MKPPDHKHEPLRFFLAILDTLCYACGKDDFRKDLTMEIRKPDFYDSFRCIAGRCPDSCCQLWDVAVDEEKAKVYRGLPGGLGDRLRYYLRDEDGETYLTLEGTRCPMWREDGLCRIQAELGEEALCKTCRDFPRLRHDYGSFLELGLELSCPEAAKIILSQDRWNWATQGSPTEEPDFDPRDMELLLTTRETAMALTQGPDPLTRLLLFTYHAQALLDGGPEEPFSPEACPELEQKADLGSFLQVFRELEILTPTWKQRLEHPAPRTLLPQDRAMLRYLISRYWLQAISDFNLVCRGKMAVSLVLLSCLLGGDPVETGQLLSKELENDAENMDALLDGAYTLPGLTDGNLLALIQSVTKHS